MMECASCGGSIKENEGMVIVNIDSEEEDIYCRRCLEQAAITLSMKGDKQPDEVELLQSIREFLDYKEN